MIGYRSLRNTLPFMSAWLGVLCGCGGSMNPKQSEQGISGTFTTYGPPQVLANCEPLVTQAEKDACKQNNERVIEGPFQSIIAIRNLDTRETRQTLLDPQGSFRVDLPPGNYELCVAEECSDPLEVRLRSFTTYGQRLPRPTGVPRDSGASAGDAPAGPPR
jgi:hypothetical protein